MAIGSKQETKGKDTPVGSIRTSQLISTFGSGSIADMPDYSVIISGIDKWDLRKCRPIEPAEKNLQRMLHVHMLRKPPVEEEKDYLDYLLELELA